MLGQGLWKTGGSGMLHPSTSRPVTTGLSPTGEPPSLPPRVRRIADNLLCAVLPPHAGLTETAGQVPAGSPGSESPMGHRAGRGLPPEAPPEPSGGPSWSLSNDSESADLGTSEWGPECGWEVGGGRDGLAHLTSPLLHFPFMLPAPREPCK